MSSLSDKDALNLLEQGVSALGGKWKIKILALLGANDALRYGQLRELLGGVSDAVLSAALRDMATDDLVRRIQYPTMPPHVEYSLTDKGTAAIPVLREIARWTAAFDWAAEKAEQKTTPCDYHSPI